MRGHLRESLPTTYFAAAQRPERGEGAQAPSSPATALPLSACFRRTIWSGMAQAFRVGDHVCWNSEAGQVSGHIVRVHTEDVDWKGYVHHASRDAPQYEIKSDKTDHVALHKGSALRRLTG